MSIELSQWMLDTMISMTLLMAFVLLIRKPVSHFFGAKVAYALWALPLARLFMPVLTLEAPAPVAVTEASPAATSSFNELAVIAPAEQISTGALASVDWLLIALIVWAGGAGMLFISKLASYVQFREDIVSDGQLVGRHDNIRILETAAVGGPLAFGLFQKYIAVPTDFYRNYSPAERELALEHEIAHHEAGDLLANFVGLLVLSLHWFNPVAWFAWVAFREDQETACDARILQNSGQDVKAIYGRTIAKSASGHQLGLASPLNQKNKIKGRLKMLGKGETSGFRKKLGMLMVGASTIVALPATATVVYVEADIAEAAVPVTGKDQSQGAVSVTNTGAAGSKKTGSITPSSIEMINSTLSEPESQSEGDNIINITMLNGSKNFENDEQYVHRIKHDGRTIVLRTNKQLSDEEVREMVEEAEESRLEADAELSEHERETREHKREMKEHNREMRLEMREVEREVEEAQREALKAAGGGWHRGPSGKIHRHGATSQTAAQMRNRQRELEREMRTIQREVERSVRQAEREARQAAREAQRQAHSSAWEAAHDKRWAKRNAKHDARWAARAKREAKRLAEHDAYWKKRNAEHEARRDSRRDSHRPTSRVWSIANQVAEISFAPRPAHPAKAHITPQINCTAMNKKIAFGGQKGGMTDQAWAMVAGCKDFKIKIDEKKLMKITLRGLQRDRAEAAKCNDTGKLKAKKLRAYDRDIKKLKARLSMT